jgi:hypothetical protein
LGTTATGGQNTFSASGIRLLSATNKSTGSMGDGPLGVMGWGEWVTAHTALSNSPPLLRPAGGVVGSVLGYEIGNGDPVAAGLGA